jgi:hypothetical protein
MAFGFGGMGGMGGLGLAGNALGMRSQQQPVQGMGQRRGGMSPMSMAGSMMPGQGGQMMRGLGGASPTMMAGLSALSDEDSKTKIRELEGELARTYAALGGGPSTGNVQPQAPDTAGLDSAYRRAGSYSYEYKDPSLPGAAPGRQAGPMADELKGIPGAVSTGPDGFDRVDIPRMTMANASQTGTNTRDIDELRREMDALMGRIGAGQSNPSGTY